MINQNTKEFLIWKNVLNARSTLGGELVDIDECLNARGTYTLRQTEFEGAASLLSKGLTCGQIATIIKEKREG